MQPETSKYMTCRTQENVCLEIGNNVNGELKINKQNEFGEVREEATESEKAVNYKNINIDVNQDKNSKECEKISVKTGGYEKAVVNKKVNFVVNEYVCSKKCETLHVNLKHFSNTSESKNDRFNNMPCCVHNLDTETTGTGTSPTNQESALSDEVNFCCGSLNHSGIVSAKFSMMISFILLIVAVHKFCRSSGDDEGNTKILVFFSGVYALCYVHCARKLISGIHKELKHKFIAWIGFSILTTLLLFSGAIYALIYYWEELIEFQNDLLVNCQTLALIVSLAVIGCILGLSFVALIILGSRLHQVDKEAGFLQIILNTWFRESVHPPPMPAGQTRGSGAQKAPQKTPMLTEQAQRTLLAFREDVRYFYRELDAARMTLILSIVFVGIFILSWWWMAFAIKQARSDGGVSLRTVLLLAVFAAVDVAASTGFILLRVIMYIRKDHLFPQEMRKPIPSLEYDQLAAYAALRLFTIQSSCGSIDILVIIVVGFLTGLRVYSVVCVFSYYKKAKNGSMDLFEHKNATGESDTSSRIERLKIMEDFGAKALVGKYSKRNGIASGLASLPRRGDRSRLGSVTGSTYDEDPPELKIQAADMPIEMQRSAVFSATQAIKLYSTEKHIAESIKQDFDQMYHPTWHCIVGRNWGSCVTHSKQCYVRLAYKDLTILLYRST